MITTARCLARVSRIVTEVTFGLPSMSPPTQDPNRRMMSFRKSAGHSLKVGLKGLLYSFVKNRHHAVENVGDVKQDIIQLIRNGRARVRHQACLPG